MSQLESRPPTSNDDYLQYRSVSLSAVATLIFAVISIPALLLPGLLVLPFIGAMMGAFSFLKIRRRQDEFVGFAWAKYGLLACVVIFVAGASRASYEYATEVPEGYDRISFRDLKPDENYPQLPIPPSAMELDGQRVFVKGYVHPGVDRRTGIRQFILVPDMKTCCFGGQPKLTDMIEVTIVTDARIDYSYSQRKLGGTLYVSPYKKRVEGLDGVYYRLDADYVK